MARAYKLPNIAAAITAIEATDLLRQHAASSGAAFRRR